MGLGEEVLGVRGVMGGDEGGMIVGGEGVRKVMGRNGEELV